MEQPMLTEKPLNDQRRAYIDYAVEASVHIGLLVLLAVACLGIMAPFLGIIAWGVIIAIAAYPGQEKMQAMLRGRAGLASIVLTLVILGCLIVPFVLLAGTLVDGLQNLAAQLREGTLHIPPPPDNVKRWPLVGVPLSDTWSAATTNFTAALQTFAPQLKSIIPKLLAASAGIGLTVLQFGVAIVLAGFILANARAGAAAAGSLAVRIFDEDGPEFERLAGSTIRSVTTGIFGVALIQTILAGLGFLVAGLPGAGLWAVMFLLAAILQVGVVVLLPAVLYGFTILGTTSAIAFAVWCVLVALLDNVLKPVLLGRGATVPIWIVFVGAIGGFVGMGMIGLFVGAVVLSVGYKLFLAWLAGGRVAA
jgi:predicted PurR-regulated permease PerM